MQLPHCLQLMVLQTMEGQPVVRRMLYSEELQMQKGDYAAAKTALLKVYGKYALTANYQWNFDGDIKNDAGVTD